MEDVPRFEQMLVQHGGIVLLKYWLDVSDSEQEERFQGRAHRSWKRWKLSPMDLFARTRWSAYEAARNDMLKRTDHPSAPWFVVPSDHKRAARLNCISHLLSRIPYEDMPPAPMRLPNRDDLPQVPVKARKAPYEPPPFGMTVPSLYNGESLTTPNFCLDESAAAECVAEFSDTAFDGSASDDHDMLYAHAGDE